MSGQSIKRRELARYENRTEVQLLELRWDLMNGAPMRALKCRVELLDELVRQTGGTLATLKYLERLGELKREVALREGQLRKGRRFLKAVRSHGS